MAPTPDPLVELLKDGAKAGRGLAASLALHVLVLVALAFVVMRHERWTEFPTTISGFNDIAAGSQKRRKAIVPVQLDTLKIEPVDTAAGKRKPNNIETPAADPETVVRKPSDVNVSGAL